MQCVDVERTVYLSYGVLNVLQEKGERTAHATYLPPPAAPPPLALALVLVLVQALPLALLLPGPPPQGLLLLLLPPPGLRARSMHQTAGKREGVGEGR